MLGFLKKLFGFEKESTAQVEQQSVPYKIEPPVAEPVVAKEVKAVAEETKPAAMTAKKKPQGPKKPQGQKSTAKQPVRRGRKPKVS